MMDELLVTDRLVLEPLTPGHAPLLFESMRDEGLYRYVDNPAPATVEQLENQFQFWSSRQSPDGRERWLNWAARLCKGDYVGWLQSTVYDDATAALAYMIFVDHWRRGYAREACVRILDHLYRDYAVTLVYATVDGRNTASVGLLEKLGFSLISTTDAANHRYEVRRPN